MLPGEHRRIFVDQSKGAAQDRRGRTAVFFKDNALGIGKVTIEQLKGRAGRPAKAVDRLVRVSDGEDVALWPSKPRENLNLGEVGVLKFVGEDEARPRTRLGQNGFVCV